uniref:APGWamide n=1 Tax=Charonia tritonis TaxID=1960912 RepID=A0A1S6JQ00_9CAEN|nr:APGWamide precursor [Charonia tritonis]
MNTLQQVFVVLLVAQLAFFACTPGVQAEEESSTSDLTITDQAAAHRQKRAPGWGKRSDNDNNDDELDNFEGDELLNNLEESELAEDKRAPGWGKRDFDTDKRAPGWGKRAPGWGKRAPGWGKRAPGWGKRAPGWGKRAPGWGKRSVLAEDSEDKRAPGWGKRAPGWGKRAPGWGKRAPGWGKRSVGVASGACQVLKEELDAYISKAVEAETQLEAFCGSNPAAFDLLSRK